MPPDLRRAHQALDRAVDRLYRRGGFASERERVEHLFMLYEKMRGPIAAATKGRRRRERVSKGFVRANRLAQVERGREAAAHSRGSSPPQ